MTLVEVNGVKLHVIDEGAGSPLLLIHGFTGTANGWTPIAEALAQDRRVIRVDLLGHGLSSSPADASRYSLPRAADDLLAFLDNLGVKDVSVAGYSFGGRVALHLALAAPKRVRALILESTSPGIAEASERKARRASDEALAQKLEKEGIESFVDHWERIPLFATQERLPADVRDAVRSERLRQSPTGLANSLRGAGAGAQEYLLPRFAELTMPVLVIAGSLDEKYCRIASDMHAALPSSRLRVVEDAGHNVHLEKPDEFIREVTAFLSEVRDGN